MQPGAVLDRRYRIVSLVKAGGMGSVYRAEDLKLNGKTCAIKEMIESFDNASDRQAGIDRFLSEVQVMEAMSHANIPRVTDHFLENNNYYFVMDFIEGTDLSTLLQNDGHPGLPPTRVLEWASQVCDALEYIHGLRPPVVHRDLKPSNLILRHSDGRILLIDFGIARVTNPSPGFWIGTCGYAPPEQQAGRHEPRSDLYALGACIHELITGVKPEDFSFASFDELGITDVPDGTWQTLETALQLHPDDRFPNAASMRQEVARVLGYQPVVESNRSFAFYESVQRLKEAAIDSPLQQLMIRYGNECQTGSLPRKLERLVFTLGSTTPFELVIQVDEGRGEVEFLERQGILDPTLLGRVDPVAADAAAGVGRCIDTFVRDYESFKNASWHIMF